MLSGVLKEILGIMRIPTFTIIIVQAREGDFFSCTHVPAGTPGAPRRWAEENQLGAQRP